MGDGHTQTTRQTTGPESLEDRVYLERVRQAYEHALGNRLRTLIMAVCVAILLWYAGAGPTALALWAVYALITNAAVAVLEFRYRAATLDVTNMRRWALYRVILGGIAASPYGGAIFLLPENVVAAELLLFIIVTAGVYVSALAFSGLPALYLAVNTGTVGLVSLGWLLRFDPLHGALLALAVIWQVTVIRKALQVSETTIDGIRTNEQLRDEIAEHEITKGQLTELNRQKDTFFSIIGHDLRGPFSVLRAYSEMLKDQAGSFSRDKIAEMSTNLNQAAEGALRLVENLLQWSQMQMQRVESSPKPCAVNDLVGETLGELKFVAREKGIRLTDRSDARTVLADPQMTRTVLRNLIGNAIKFTPEAGEITVTSGQSNGAASITVSDTGVGMAPEQVATLFAVGDGKSTTGTRGESGTGFGLALCDELVRIQGGRIAVESAPGRGSTFTVTLPLAAPSAGTPDERAGRAETRTQS